MATLGKPQRQHRIAAAPRGAAGVEPGPARRAARGRRCGRHPGDGQPRPRGARRGEGAHPGRRRWRTRSRSTPRSAPPPDDHLRRRDGRVRRRGRAQRQPRRAAHAAGLRARRRLRARPRRPPGRARDRRRRRHGDPGVLRAGRWREGRSRARRARGPVHAASERDPRDGRETRGQAMPKRVVLAYSGGLDTSVAVRGSREEWGVEVVALRGRRRPVGRRRLGDDPPARARGRARSRRSSSTRATSSPRDYVAPALQANALYEGKYPLVSALSRPVIVGTSSRAAREHGADAVAHGCTGKGNDQVRFEVSVAQRSRPTSRCSRPVRVWGFTREDSIDYAAKHDIPINGDEGEARTRSTRTSGAGRSSAASSRTRGSRRPRTSTSSPGATGAPPSRARS